MKIAINYRVIEGPWGGGNNFVKSLIEFLVESGDTVVFDLEDKNIDLILVVDPRSHLKNISFGARKILMYKLFVNPKVKVVHRINECDERKKTKLINWILRQFNFLADHSILISTWLSEMNVLFAANRRMMKYSVILNGGNPNIFKPTDLSDDRASKQAISIVTHHWGADLQKGWEIYGYLDQLIGRNSFPVDLKFTFIGNLPEAVSLRHSRHLAPISGEPLAKELATHDLYLTASLFEPGGMHHIEGALCGLPVLYRFSGAIPEYASNYGVSFGSTADFEASLALIIERLPILARWIQNYPHRDDRMCQRYRETFENVISSGAEERDLLRLVWHPVATCMCLLTG